MGKLSRGQIHLRDAIRRKIDFTTPEGETLRFKREYSDVDCTAPRVAPGRKAYVGGWISSAGWGLFDFGFTFTTMPNLIKQGHGSLFLPS